LRGASFANRLHAIAALIDMSELPVTRPERGRDARKTKIRSVCLRCGEIRIVSAMDGSLDDWKDGHKCSESKPPSPTPSPSQKTA
jgi:hypothetical protein